MSPETPSRIEPARLEEPTGRSRTPLPSSRQRRRRWVRLYIPAPPSNLADLVRIMNTYYSNLIEGHDTRPRDIERALAGELDKDEGRRDLQLEAAAHVRVQREVDRMCG